MYACVLTHDNLHKLQPVSLSVIVLIDSVVKVVSCNSY